MATMVSQLARQKDINVISIVRQTYNHLNLQALLGSSYVINLSKRPVSIRDPWR
ncbi:hypothetical protein [Shimazuella alba]|uniref:Uncharacterized protein n=1 Tax=Shimazuella alba TaxID=2690964 RepID=A0A6I4VUJ5_9BACL|nr:hypothetical protein [Shimazuella alba]MXQ53845.1 hypothetical protein [Shimazuella alba]